MTDNEIIKALERCKRACVNRCEGCPYRERLICALDLRKDALDLINRQKADIETLENNLKFVRGTLTRAIDENDRLQAECDKNFEKWKILDDRTKQRYAELYEEAKGIVRAEAIKEFAERLKKNSIAVDVSFGYGREHYAEAVTVIAIDSIVKGMVGEG